MVVTLVSTRYCLNYGLIWYHMVVRMVVIWFPMVMTFSNTWWCPKFMVVGWCHMVVTFGDMVVTRTTICSGGQGCSISDSSGFFYSSVCNTQKFFNFDLIVLIIF